MENLGFTLFNYNHRYYDVGGDILFSICRTSSGYYELIEKDKNTGDCIKYLFSGLEDALAEIVSYCEIPASDFEEV